jgi:hypothetical protein
MLVYIALIVIICAYVYIVLKPKKDFQILQSSLSNMSDDMLYEKYPICINDQIINVQDLLQSLFKFQYIFVDHFTEQQPYNRVNHSKFLVIHNNHPDNCDLFVSSPNKNTDKVRIILPPYNVIILPYLWSVSTEDKCNLSGMSLNDFTHFLLNIHVN